VLLGLSYLVVREQFEPQVERRAAPAGDSSMIARAERSADVERRVREEERRRDEEALGDVLGWFAAVLGLLTVASVGIGWLVAGRAHAPVSRITGTARRVSGRSLHERIALDGPRDELKELADTFDAMLARLDTTFETTAALSRMPPTSCGLRSSSSIRRSAETTSFACNSRLRARPRSARTAGRRLRDQLPVQADAGRRRTSARRPPARSALRARGAAARVRPGDVPLLSRRERGAGRRLSQRTGLPHLQHR
jgi:hypothetical protein